MASRQNREARKEYPTGHNKGNDSPDRDVPRANGGNDNPRSYGAPPGVPPVSDSEAGRQAILAMKDVGGTAAEHILEHRSDSAAETRRAVEQEARDRPTEVGEEPSPTADLRASTAYDRIKAQQEKNQAADRD